MDIKLCRICGKQDENLIHIFKTEGLKNKIETCLPIVISRQSPLPDTICNCCMDSVDNFYSFIKNCLQNIIVLEAQYEIIESCLKTKRKVDKSVNVNESDIINEKIDIRDINVNENIEDVSIEIVKPILKTINDITPSVSFTKDLSPIPNFSCSLVDYDSSDSDDENIDSINDFIQKTSIKTDNEQITDVTQNTQQEQNNLINEIVQRKYLKRKNEDIISSVSKIARIENESSSRRKNKAPKRVEYHLETKIQPTLPILPYTPNDSISEKLLNLPADISVTREDVPIQEPMQTCLLCEQQFFGPIPLTAHMYETHGIDLAQVFAAAQSQVVQVVPHVDKPSPKKKLPELVKISDVLNVRKQLPQEIYDDPPILEPQVPDVMTTAPSPVHLSALSRNQYTCQECDGEITVYTSFKDYSNHRRSQHQIFHCDLCPKFYGRNSHLWKHVNRVHKGHPSITCQQCYKTSASKYHLSQHFNKMHSVKSQKPKPPTTTKSSSGYCTPEENDEDFMTQKFQGFDFKSVRQSFLRQDMLEKQKKKEEEEEGFKPHKIEIKKEPEEKIEEKNKSDKSKKEIKSEPKEIDSSSNLYTNIITNYTPPTNEGAYKCPKCFKGFHKKNLLKKHKKNCRPRLQKDLLTRCKTCSRIFKDRQSLAKHLINYHSLYKCEICNLEVQSKCEIVSHIRFSHPNCELTCHCGQILRSKSDLQKHKLDHRDSHVCQFCGDMLPTKIKLKMHILSLHRKILSLSCGICLKLFETQHILRDHVNVVHGDQLSPLTSCTVCGKNYGSKWKTYDHLNKSHGRIFKACKACLEVFESEQDLQKHFEMDHLNAKSGSEKKIQKTEKESYSDANETMQDFVQGDEGSTSESDDGETSGESSGVQNPKTAQEEVDYRNYVIKEYQTNLERKEQNGIKTETKKSDIKSQETKLSLLEKRLLGQKVKDEHNKKKDKEIIENGNRSEKKKHKNEKYDEDPMQNSSKRTVYVNSNDPSLCEICLKVWPAKKHLWQHYIRCHKQVAATVCGICLKTNPSYSSLQTHLRETHPNLLYGCGFGSNFICKICGRYHNASSKLKLHMAIHVGFNENMLENFNDIKDEIPVLKEEPQVLEQDEESIEYEEINDDIKLEIKEEIIGTTEEIDDMNYESLIEEVEVYSDSDNDDNVSITQNIQEEQISEEETDGEDSIVEDSENEATENELEQEMLKNMIGENVTIVTNQDSNDTNSYQSYEVKQEIIIEDNYDVDSCKVKMEVCSSDEWTNSPQFLNKSDERIVLYQRKELDNAIRSISCDSPENDSEYSDVNTTLIENEIEAAVGSIL